MFCTFYNIISGVPVDGAELALLIKLLVTAANQGSLAEVAYDSMASWIVFDKTCKESKDAMLYGVCLI